MNENSNRAMGDNSHKPMGDNSQRLDRIKKISGDTEIYIGNISLEASKDNLINFFSEVNILSLRMVKRGNKVFGFANFPDITEAEKAIELYHFNVFMGHKLIVRLANYVNQNLKPETVPPMPELEDIEDDKDDESASDSDDESCNSPAISAPIPLLEDTASENNGQDADYFKIYIGNISVKASKDDLINFFSEVNILSLRMVKKGNKVFAFANFKDLPETEKAIELYNNKNFMGCKLVIRHSDDRTRGTRTQMPQIEDIGNDDCSERASAVDDKSCNRKMFEDMVPEKNSSDSSHKSHHRDNNKSANRKLGNPCIGSQEDFKHNGQATDLPKPVMLFVGNFPYGTSKEQLFSLFRGFNAFHVNIINNHNPKRSTQAMVNFRSQKESEKAIEKIDKTQYKGSTLLVTFAGFCPCQDNQKSNNEKKASPPRNSLHTMDQGNGTNSSHKKIKQPDRICSPQKPPQQGRRNCNSTPPLSPNDKTSNRSSKNGSNNKDLAEHILQKQDGNRQQKNSQIDMPFKAEVAKMTILVENFRIRPSSVSSTDIVQVIITSVVSNEFFWGNIFSSLESSDLTDFMVLHNELQSSAKSWPKYIVSKREMKCIALYQGEWYRAWVLKSVKEEAVEVFFLDYGNISVIQLDDVRSSDESVWKLPPKARAFKIDSNSEKLPPNAENRFFDVKICKAGNRANGFISVATLVSV